VVRKADNHNGGRFPVAHSIGHSARAVVRKVDEAIVARISISHDLSIVR